MSARSVRRVGPQEGYDRWATTYDTTPNPVVAMDQRHALRVLAPVAGECVLDAGCGTGRHLRPLRAAGCSVVGVDFSMGMLQVARERAPDVPLVRADLERALPLRSATFDAALCALVGEHVRDLRALFGELARVLVPGGRMTFTVYHPQMALAGIEANFEADGIEFRLGAVAHTAMDYIDAIRAAGLAPRNQWEFVGDAALTRELPKARKYEGAPLLFVVTARRP